MESFRAYQERIGTDTGPGYYRTIGQKRKESMIRLYARSAMAQYRGFDNRMERFAREGDAGQKRIAMKFSETKKDFH